jgi:hypothetical protein
MKRRRGEEKRCVWRVFMEILHPPDWPMLYHDHIIG